MKEVLVGEESMRGLERDVMLHVLDTHWKEHLAAMDYLRQSVGLRGYAQKDPKQEYKREAFEIFEDLLEKIKHDVVVFFTKLQISMPEEAEAIEEQHRLQHEQKSDVEYSHAEAENVLAPQAAGSIDDEFTPEALKPFKRDDKKVGRNDPCPCNSGKKYKQCHGKLS